MSKASIQTLADWNILDANPTFAKSFWQYDAGFMRVLMSTPRLACQQAWNARDACLEAAKKWLASAWSSVDYEAMTKEDHELEMLKDMPLEARLGPEDIAKTYWDLHTQSRRGFINEVDIWPILKKW